MEIEIINGPNLNLLGVREPGIYGSEGFDTYLAALRQKYPDVTINYYQSNEEGKLIDRIHATGFTADGIILNAGARKARLSMLSIRKATAMTSSRLYTS